MRRARADTLAVYPACGLGRIVPFPRLPAPNSARGRRARRDGFLPHEPAPRAGARIHADTPVDLGLMLALSLASCSKTSTPATSGTAGGNAEAKGFKIGVMTGTVSQGEEDFRAGQQVQQKYGSARDARHLPRQLHDRAGDGDRAAHRPRRRTRTSRSSVIAQAIPGSVAAARKIRETRARHSHRLHQPARGPGRHQRRLRHRRAAPTRLARGTHDHRDRAEDGRQALRPLLVPAPHVAAA